MVDKINANIDLQKVLEFATEKHKGQFRDNGDPYIVHPIRVAKIVDQYKGQTSKNREILLAAALLHDTLEDTYTSYKELSENFGKIVASMVVELTTAPYVPKMIGKAKYLSEKMIDMTSYSLIIKLADRLDNLSDLANSTEAKKIKTINDTKYILEQLTSKRELTTAQTNLVNAIKNQINVLENKEEIIL